MAPEASLSGWGNASIYNSDPTFDGAWTEIPKAVELDRYVGPQLAAGRVSALIDETQRAVSQNESEHGNNDSCDGGSALGCEKSGDDINRVAGFDRRQRSFITAGAVGLGLLVLMLGWRAALRGQKHQ